MHPTIANVGLASTNLVMTLIVVEWNVEEASVVGGNKESVKRRMNATIHTQDIRRVQKLIRQQVLEY